MKVFVSNRQKSVPISSQSVKRVVGFVIENLSVSTDFLYVHFVGERALAKLHSQLFNDPSLTDTITVPIDAPGEPCSPHVLGEIFIDPKAAQRYLSKKAKEITHEALYEEITRYLVHSILHLVGYDDIDPKDRKRMKTKENFYLSMLKEADLIIKA
ncbi:rRNA maturation RNase YbeY [Chlamydiifrater phoenicopteri]|uniref:rRNA maturation RNase YbeY n=1 Tax=Chlamydiifrater phoenicopteri TaxID=2681469 RepID=UPI001BCC7262|nr:rRNA maturation RNase YbeY [Chlamydiifrater phoenicopteri]